MIYVASASALLTAHASEEYISAALEARADGYVLKDSGNAELISAIRTVAKGQSFLCKGVTETVLSSYFGRGDASARRNPLHLITNREREVLVRIASGHTNKLVARELNLSVKTVEKHRANLMEKLNLHNVQALTTLAIEKGLVSKE